MKIGLERLVAAYNSTLPAASRPLQFDPEQLKAIRCDRNTVVAAGAGAGKTTVLSWRFVRLMAERGLDCDRILTLTFTNKAALEMKDRIKKLIIRFSECDTLSPAERNFFKEQVEKKFKDASICTLDSFCSRIVKGSALFWGLAFDFTGGDIEQNRKNYKRIARELLSGDTPGARLLSANTAGGSLLDKLADYASREYELPRSIDRALADRFIESVEARDSQIKSCISSLVFRVAQLPDPGTKKARELWKRCRDWSGTEDWQSYLENPISFKGNMGKKSELAQLVDKEMKERMENLNQTVQVTGAFLDKREDLYDVVEFLSLYLDAVQRDKRASGMLGFNDISSLAVETLIRFPDVRHRYNDMFDAIMIDEFQDNNLQQKQLLFLLSAKKSFGEKEVPSVEDLVDDKLFFVGDEKQSIYKFRGADVAVFKALSEEFSTGEFVRMETNYRSSCFLLQLFNDIFSTVMAPDGEPAPYEALFYPLKGVKTPASSCTLLDVTCAGEQDEASISESESYHIAALIKEMVTEGDSNPYRIEEGGSLRAPRFEDIAILMRSTGKQMDLEKALNLFDIPYQITSVPRSLMIQAPVNDLYNVLQLLVYPDDRIAYLAALRSPVFRVDDALAYRIVKKGDEPFDPESSPDPVYQSSCRFFARLKEEAPSLSLPLLVRKLWILSGYRVFLLSKTAYHSYMVHGEYLYRLAEKYRQLSLASFLSEKVRPFLGSAEKVETGNEALAGVGDRGVKLMTMHASKGLEFPVVIVADFLKRETVHKESIKLDGKFTLPEFFEGMKNPFDMNEEATERAEIKRLVYVAFTRAESHLVVSGSRRKGQKENEAAVNQAVFSLLGNHPSVTVRERDGVSRSEFFRNTGRSETSPEGKRESYLAPDREYDLRESSVAVTSAVSAEPESFDGERLPPLECDSYLTDRTLITAFGTFAHALVMRDMGVYAEGRSDSSLFDEAFGTGVSNGLKRVCIASAKSLSEKFLSSSCYRTRMAGRPVSAEKRFCMYRDGTVYEGSIDIVVQTPEGYEVYDFKTDSYRNPSVHSGQLSLYREAVERGLGRCTKSGIIYLRDPEKSEVYDD